MIGVRGTEKRGEKRGEAFDPFSKSRAAPSCRGGSTAHRKNTTKSRNRSKDGGTAHPNAAICLVQGGQPNLQPSRTPPRLKKHLRTRTAWRVYREKESRRGENAGMRGGRRKRRPPHAIRRRGRSIITGVLESVDQKSPQGGDNHQSKRRKSSPFSSSVETLFL